jgi:predicted transposase YbfD/YdcC
MKHSSLLAAVALASIIGVSGCGLKKDTKAAEAEVDRFHKHWNADEFKAVYDEAHANFRNSQTADEITATLQRVKRNYGAFKSAVRRSWGFSTDNGVTDVKLKYDSAYENGSAVEAFVYRMSGDKALLVSYDIMSPETAKKREEDEKAQRDEKRKAEEEKRKAEREARRSPRKP